MTSTGDSPTEGDHQRLRAFRGKLYGCLGRRADALFELCDAVLTAGAVPSPPHLSLAPTTGGAGAASTPRSARAASTRRVSRTRWPVASRATTPRPTRPSTPWTSRPGPGRGYYYDPSRHSAGQPIAAGWAYQLVARLGFERDSWVAPADARRVRPEDDANEVAVEQVWGLVGRLPGQRRAPLFVFDAGYDPVRLQLGLEGCRAQILVRLHSGRTFYADPELPPKRPVGRPHRHGRKFSCKDPKTWPEPSAQHRCDDPGYGSVRVRAWYGLHPKTRRVAERYGGESAALAKGTVVLVEVGRLPRGERRRKPKALWLWWHGDGAPDLGLLWRAYCRRFDVEHFVRFLKQALGWTTPRVPHPEQADRWTWLVLSAYAQLVLARAVAEDRRLPWERPLTPRKLTPTRVLRFFVSLLPLLGTPAEAPKPCGRSPGRPRGSRSGPAERYPALKKAA